MPKIIYVANTDWYLFNFRLSLMKAMADRGWEVLAAAPVSAYWEKLEEAGIRFWPLRVDRKGKNPFRDLGLVFRLFRLYRRERPEIVHHFTIKPVIYGSFAAKLVPNVFVVNAVTGLGYVFEEKGWTQKVVEGLYHPALKGKSVAIFQNPENFSYFVKRKLVSEERSFLVKGSGVDVQTFAPEDRERKEPGKGTVFLMVARMLWDKGVREFVSAAGLVRKTFPDAEFWMVGGVDKGNPSSVPVSWLREAEARGDVKWWGHREDVVSFFREADVVVLPSHHEGLPKTLLEGAAMGKPLIATDIPGCREVVADGENGMLVPVKDAGKLAEAMVFMIKNSLVRKKMGEKGRQKTVREFSDVRVVEETIGVYKRVRPELFPGNY